MIDYRDGHEHVDFDQLECLMLSAGWDGKRVSDRVRLTAQVRNSMYVVSAWDGEKLVGFSRAISDGVTNGYIGTVVVHADYRKRGIGRALVLRILGNRDGVQFVLHARPEVHDFYLKLGFEPAKDMFRRRRKF